jgi:RNA-binding protein YhbY
MESGQRQHLKIRAQRMKPRASIAAGSLSESVLSHVRTLFDADDLVKVRVVSSHRIEVEAVADALSRGVPCEVVQRVGRVLTLFRRMETADNN